MKIISLFNNFLVLPDFCSLSLAVCYNSSVESFFLVGELRLQINDFSGRRGKKEKRKRRKDENKERKVVISKNIVMDYDSKQAEKVKKRKMKITIKLRTVTITIILMIMIIIVIMRDSWRYVMCIR